MITNVCGIVVWTWRVTSDCKKTTSTEPYPKDDHNCGTAIHGPRHISTTGVTMLLRPKQPHILKKLQSHCLIAEQAREKHHVRSTIFRQHRTSVWQPRGERRPPQPFFVLRYDFLYLSHHYIPVLAQGTHKECLLQRLNGNRMHDALWVKRRRRSWKEKVQNLNWKTELHLTTTVPHMLSYILVPRLCSLPNFSPINTENYCVLCHQIDITIL